MRYLIGLVSAMFMMSGLSQAEIVSSGPDHFTLKIEATSEMRPEEVWARLIDLPSWWKPAHTYSGSSDNLSLELKPGGLWREDWEGGATAHGIVLYYEEDKVLRLDAPFGPLQGMGVSAVWTISIEPHEDGSKVVFDEVVNGSSTSNLAPMAEAVHFVKTEAINSLVAAE